MLIGQPVDSDVDVGVAVRKGQYVEVKVFSGSSVLSPGSPTDKVEAIDRVLSPVSQQEVGTIRCIGLNYREHAAEAGMAVPDVPVVFMCVALLLAYTVCTRVVFLITAISLAGSRTRLWQTPGRRQLRSPSTRSRMTAPTTSPSSLW